MIDFRNAERAILAAQSADASNAATGQDTQTRVQTQADIRAAAFKDCIDAIRGAIEFGKQDVNHAPTEHWLAEFWDIGRKLAAPAAPASEPAALPIEWEPLPEDAAERARFDRTLPLYLNDPRVAVATALAIWGRAARPNDGLGLMCCVLANEVAKMHIAPVAAPTSAAPKCTRCEYIGKCDCEPAPAGQPILRIYAEGDMRTVTEWLDGARDLSDGDHTLYVAPAPAAQAATPADCTCPSGNGSLRHPYPVLAVEPVADPLEGWTFERTNHPAWLVTEPDDKQWLCFPWSVEYRLVELVATSLFSTPADAASEADKSVDELLERFKHPLTPYGMLVRALRIVANKTLMDMANYVGKRPSQLSAMEHGRTPVTYQDAVDASAFFNSCGIPVTLHALEYARDVQRERQQGAQSNG
jgi:hypothetical protein